jgi:alpha-D-xyloside xylohydrolase
MAWRDQDSDEQAVRELVARHEQERLPLGAVWIDNPFEERIGDLAPSPKRFDDFDRLVDDLHAKGLRVVTWVSPYVTEQSRLDAPLQGVGGLVTGTPEHNDDSTYIPRRGLSPHVDFTNDRARRIWQAGLQDLLARGVDGVKADRGEEDLSDGAVFADGRPNRLNHNDYVRLYDETAYDAFRAMGRGDDFLVIARGGYSGSARHAAQWAGDNVSLAGRAGLDQALNSLLSLSMSGFPWSGSDIGGYVGTRQDRSGDPVGVPTKGTYVRWAQLGALSPVMQTAIPAYEFDAETVEIYRRYAELHTALAPYTAAAAERSRTDGVPVVRPLPFAFPEDPVALQTDDAYLYGPDLLVAPIHDSSVEAGGPGARQVHLPAGGWTDFWTGQRFTGPTTFGVVAPLDVLPLYVRDGAQLPAQVEAMRAPAQQVPPASTPPTSAQAPAAGAPGAAPAAVAQRALPATGGSAALLGVLLLAGAAGLVALRRSGARP